MREQDYSGAKAQARFQSSNSWLGNISHLDQFQAVITSDHASELRQYFRTGGLDRFNRSTISGMLERAELYSAGTRPCEKCGGHINRGTWIEKDADGNEREVTDPVPERGGCGFVPSNSSRCKAVSSKQAEMLALIGIEQEQVPLAADEVCPDCRCRGWIVAGRHQSGPLTARPSLTASHGGKSEGNIDLELQTAAICGRRLERAEMLFPLAVEAISAFFYPGSIGIGSLWHLTPAGKKMLKGNSTNTSPEQFFAARRVAQEKNRDPNVAKQFEACDAQSSAILEAAGRAWNAVVSIEGSLDECGI